MGRFKKGLEVKCVDDDFHDEKTNPYRMGDLNLPKEGKTYIIREIVRTSYGDGIRLMGVVNKKYYFEDIKGFEEPIFSVKRFKIVH
ncbi:MAG: hypothetical protein NUV46_00885 [Nanoarchaeota archaeon]|nr:hypothetical protein [Nanoarchaeota archaeon]